MSKPTTKTGGQPAGQSHEAAVPLDLDDNEGSASLLTEFYIFLKENKKWWLLPMVLMIVLLGAIIIFGSSGALGPMIYTLF